MRSHGFIAANDDAAFEHARQYVDGHDIDFGAVDASLRN